MITRVRTELREYIVATWLSGDPRGFADDTDLQQAGVLDSFSTMALIAHLEQAFQIELEPADVNAETFRSVETISRLILERLPGKEASK